MSATEKWLDSVARYELTWPQTQHLLKRLERCEPGTERYTRTLNRICEGNLLLVAHTIKKLLIHRCSIKWNDDMASDLLQVGYLGLREAVIRYDASKGTRLSTIAVSWIKQRVGRWMNNYIHLIYVPENTLREVYHIRTHGKKSGRKSATTQLSNLLDADLAIRMGSTDLKLKDSDEPGATVGEMIIAPEPEGQSDPELRAKLDYLMDKVNLDDQTRAIMEEYMDCGDYRKAAVRAGWTVRKGSAAFREACQAMAQA